MEHSDDGVCRKKQKLTGIVLRHPWFSSVDPRRGLRDRDNFKSLKQTHGPTQENSRVPYSLVIDESASPAQDDSPYPVIS